MIRRAIGTTLAGLCALTGPLAGSALADNADPPPLTLSVASVRPGVAFTVTAETSCPAESGSQTVDFSFTDSEGVSSEIGTALTGPDGSWSAASVQLPVNGVDDAGGWLDSQVAAGAGVLDAVCTAPDPSAQDAPDDPLDPEDPQTDPGDNPDETVITQEYASTALSVADAAAQLTVTPGLSDGASSVTVTPSEPCPGTGAAEVDLTVLAVGDDAREPLATPSLTTSADGAWGPVSITLPADATGDYAVSATCSRANVVSLSYDAAPLAIGSVLVGPATCTARGATAQVTGSYGGLIAGSEDGLSLPTTLKLTGDGPWKVKINSDATGQLLAAGTLTCDHPRYDVDVPQTGVSKSGQVRARVCNSGRAPVDAVLQLLKGTKGTSVDRETVKPSDCVWLQGGKLAKGKVARAQVLLDPPGAGNQNATVAQKFSVRRGKH
jgi:hypothetical protein